MVEDSSGRITIGPTKTGRVPSVALPATLTVVLPVHVQTYPGLVFSAPEGGPVRHKNFMRRHFRPPVRAALARPTRFHDLRHTHAALLIAQGVHPRAIRSDWATRAFE